MVDGGFGRRVRQEREQARLSQARLAEEAGISDRWLGQLESGRSQASESAIIALWTALRGYRSDLSLTWLLTGSVEAMPMDRRGFLGASVGASLAVPATLALRMMIARPAAPLDPELLDVWEERTANFSSARVLESPRLLHPQIEAHLAVMEMHLMTGGRSESASRRLASLVAGTSGIGAWVALMAGRRDDAWDYLVRGEELAREVGDTDALVMLLMLRSDYFSAVKAGGDGGRPELARAALDEAMTYLTPSSPMTLAAPVVMRAAEEYAAARLDDQALRLLDRGRELVATSPVRDHYLRRRWPSILPDTFEGSILQLIGRPADALRVLEPIESPSPSHRSLMRLDRAAAHGKLGELDAAVGLISQALEEARGHGHLEIRTRAQGVRKLRLVRWDAEAAVRRLDEQLASVR